MMVLIPVEIGQPPRANPKDHQRREEEPLISGFMLKITNQSQKYLSANLVILVTDSIIKALKTGEFLDLEFPITQLIMPPYLKNLGNVNTPKHSHLKIKVD